MWHAIHVIVHCIDMVLIVFFISGIWFFAVEFEPASDYHTSEGQFSTTEEQGKHNLLSTHIWFQSIWFLYYAHGSNVILGQGLGVLWVA